MGRCVSLAALVIAVASPALLGAQKLGLDAPIDFSITLQDLSEMAAADGDREADYESYVVLEGYISATIVAERTEERFRAYVDLVQGEWEDLEQVRTHQGRLVVEGNDYQDRVFDRPPRNPSPDDIIPGRRALAVARLIRFDTHPTSGRTVPVMETVALRIVR